MSDDSEPASGGISIKRERTLKSVESLKIESERGSAGDRDKVRKFIEREAELDVPDGFLDNVPSLIGESEIAETVGEVAAAMEQTRENVEE